MTPPRGIIDTNVLISGLLFGGTPGEVLTAARSGRVVGVVSLHILWELREVMLRPRFGFDAGLVDGLIDQIVEFCEVVAVEHADHAWTRDPKDDPVVQAALVGRVAFVVTGDRHLLELSSAAFECLTPVDVLPRLAQGDCSS